MKWLIGIVAFVLAALGLLKVADNAIKKLPR